MYAKATATGKIDGVDVTIQCIQAKESSPVKVFIYGEIDKEKKENIKFLIGEKYQLFFSLQADADPVPFYNPEPGTIEAYLNAIHLNNVFDSDPKIEIEGDVDIFGAPFDDWSKPEYKDVVF